MGYREVYTASNMADEEYNISDKGLSITPEILRIQVNPGGIAEGQFPAQQFFTEPGPDQLAL